MMEISQQIDKQDVGSRIVDSLRGRLLAERVATKAAKEEAENLAKRVCALLFSTPSSSPSNREKRSI